MKRDDVLVISVYCSGRRLAVYRPENPCSVVAYFELDELEEAIKEIEFHGFIYGGFIK